MEAVVQVSQNSYFVWQTLLAVVMLIAAGASGLGWLNKRIAKPADLEALRKELAAVKAINSSENDRILRTVRELKADLKQTVLRLERHIDSQSDRISATKGTGDE